MHCMFLYLIRYIVTFVIVYFTVAEAIMRF